jgi:hypothetical protein
MRLNPEQFAEHLSGLEDATGIRYHPGAVTLPNGLRVPALHDMAVAPAAGASGGRVEVASYLPSETGSMHKLGVRHFPHDGGDFLLEHYSVPSILRASEEDYLSGKVDKNVHRSGPLGAFGHGSTARESGSVGDWADSVGRSLSTARPPSDSAASLASKILMNIGRSTRGGSVVRVWDSDFDARDRRDSEPDFEFDLGSR